MLYIILGIVIVVLLLVIGIALLFGSYKAHIVRINEAEQNIDASLKKIFDLLSSSIPVVKANIEKKEDEILDRVIKLRSRKLNSFELDISLNKDIIEFLELVEKYPELKEVDAFIKIYRNVRTNEENLVACKRYYNDIIVRYNRMLKKFPTNVIGKISKYQEKDFYLIDADYSDEDL